jgi:hypothetical protein
MLIGEDGRVIKVQANGPVHLQEAAEATVKQWIYSPTIAEGHAVEVVTEAYLEYFLPY